MPKHLFPCRYLVRNLFPLLVLVFLPWLLLQSLSNPACVNPNYNEDDVQLIAMVVGDLHLAGPKTMWFDRVRREAFMKTSFKRAYEMLKPHALLVLGDISDWGRKSTKGQWDFVTERFYDMVSPCSGLPIHATVGNHDVGDFHQLTPALLQQFVDSFPGLDETGNEVFTVRNISFVSLNAMALACAECPLHSSVQSAVEKAKDTLQKGSSTKSSRGFPRRGDSTLAILKNPVLLLHLPLYRVDESVCLSIDVPRCAPWHEVEGGCLPFGTSAHSSPFKLTPYRSMMDMLSLNTSKYLLSALKPRLVLSAHAHRYCNRVHDDGTREVTVSTFTWRNRDDPSFLLIHFLKDGATEIQQCFLPRESLVLGLNLLQGFVFIAVLAIGGIRYKISQRRGHLKT